MSPHPEPWWPVILLALIQLVDAVLCIKPVAFVRRCLQDVRFPESYWRLLAPLKTSAAAGLVLGLWVEYLALVTTLALTLYFAVAIAMHIGARDLGRNLFVNAPGMLVVCLGALWTSFGP